MLGRLGTGLRLWRVLRLVWPLFRDRRVPLVVKSVPIVALLYAISPVDLVPDFFPALGQLDDLSVLLLSLLLFVRLCPPEVVREHLEPTAEPGRKSQPEADKPGRVIDGEYEILD